MDDIPFIAGKLDTGGIFYSEIPSDNLQMEDLRRCLATIMLEKIKKLYMVAGTILITIGILSKIPFQSPFFFFLQNFFLLLLPAIAIFIPLTAIVAFRQINLFKNIDSLKCKLRKLDWYIGEAEGYLILARMDIGYELANVFSRAKPDDVYSELETVATSILAKRASLPPDTPLLVCAEKKLSTLKGSNEKNMYRLAVIELCLRQQAIGNENFFSHPDYWNYYWPYH